MTNRSEAPGLKLPGRFDERFGVVAISSGGARREEPDRVAAASVGSVWVVRQVESKTDD